MACDGDGLPVFDRLPYRCREGRVFLFAFDLLELNGPDMLREPLESKARLASVLAKGRPGLRLETAITRRSTETNAWKKTISP